MGQLLTRRRMMREAAASGPAGLSYYETAGSEKQYFDISTPFTPAAIFAWDTYRWNNSNFGSNQVCIYALWDSTHGSICAKPYSTTAVTPTLNNASYSNGQFNNGKSSNFMASRTYVIIVLSADALTNGIADYVYVEEWTGDGGTSHATSCPFTPDFWIFYNTTSMDNGANTNKTAIFRMTDNLNLGYYLGNTASGTSISSSAAAISAVNTGATVSTSRKFTSGQSYKFIAVKKP